MKCTINVKDEVWCTINGLTHTHIEILWKEFGIFVDGYFFMPAYKLGKFDGKIRFFDKYGKTYVRLLDQIIPYLEKWGYDIALIDNRSLFKQPIVPGQITKFDTNGIALEATGLDLLGDITLPNGHKFLLRPYQLQCIQQAAENGSGFIIAATSSGKTSITAGISHVYSQLGYNVITVVPSGDLVDQTSEWYALLGMDVGVYSGETKDIEHPHVVATWQALQYNPSILERFQVVIWDESQQAKCAVAGKLLNEYGKHIPFRFGVTGTFPKSDVDQMTLKSSIGSIFAEISAKWLMDNDYISKLEIQPVELHETYVDEEFPDYDAEKSFLSKSSARMEKIADLIISQCAIHGNTLVLVNSIPFGKKLSALIKDSIFLYGESAKDLRREHYDMFDKKDDLIVIASSGIASTGISIDRIFCLIMVDPGKSFVRAIQSIGRSLRKSHDKEKAIVVDVHSKLKWARKHFRERKKYYDEANYQVLPVAKLKVHQK